jgi:4-hydroxymandelate oxidase
VVVTVDVPQRGRREAEERIHFAMPPGVATALLAAPAGTCVSTGASGTAVAAEINAVFDPTLTWNDLDWLASLSPLPVLLKGILHPADAVLAVEYGARAILVSNHGGRQLDSAVAALDALPAVVEAVAGRVEVFVDGGVRRGTDVLKALALGARAVLIGRPIHWGLAVSGEAGVRHVLELLRAELALDLMLCGLASPVEVDRALILPA